MLRPLRWVHPEEVMYDALRARFAGLPGARVVRAISGGLGPHDCFVTGRLPFPLA